MRRLRIVIAVACLLAVTAASVGCSGADSGPGTPIKVFAAASLQGAFDDLAAAFVAAEPGYAVAPIVYDGSSALATQIVEGADVDVIAFADESSLRPVTAAGRAGPATVFATNTLQIAVAPGNPKHLTGLADLARPDVTTVLCAPEVPCGKAARRLLDAAHVAVRPVSEETNVTSVVTRVRAGEADAGLVYKTDVAAAGAALTGITPADAEVAVNRYPIAVATAAPSPAAARAFVDFVRSPAGEAVLARHGFGPP
ncbi:molybdate ABC transporter substrate-binding protein [Gordonia sp. (in: high G+C Gram-positive bacteria)]|uniref:molybdate ABC transporter substrate-binding protein n=1 Tax=Gordonia sp. (in: high G+C Gram-positive bacteria) TaxID=84139 RepID=UPI003C76247A